MEDGDDNNDHEVRRDGTYSVIAEGECTSSSLERELQCVGSVLYRPSRVAFILHAATARLRNTETKQTSSDQILGRVRASLQTTGR